MHFEIYRVETSEASAIHTYIHTHTHTHTRIISQISMIEQAKHPLYIHTYIHTHNFSDLQKRTSEASADLDATRVAHATTQVRYVCIHIKRLH
jgi:hypothetical protein